MATHRCSSTSNRCDAKPVFDSFAEASEAVLRVLHERIGMELWMITRVQRDNWIILKSLDQKYGVSNGQVIRWSDSFCSRMVRGLGPRIAADAMKVPAYRDAPIARRMRIGAYIGIPLARGDGSLFGTLCAVSPEVKPQQIEQEQPFIELLTSLLSTILSQELAANDAARQVEKSRADAQRDSLTGLFNHRGWNELLALEQVRCERYGHPACVLSIDLNGLKKINDDQGHEAGDQLIRKAALAITEVSRTSEIIARPGGDEFLVLAVESDLDLGEFLLYRIRDRFTELGISAAFGIAEVIGGESLAVACQAADRAMYENKKSLKVGVHYCLAP